MADTTSNNSKHTPAEQLFINALPARRLMDFRNYMYSPLYITSNAAGFLCHEWIDLPALKGFLASSATAADSNASTRPDVSPADKSFLDSLSVAELNAFRSYVYSPAYILSNAPQFLDLTWVDTRSLRSFLAQNMKAITSVPPSLPVSIKVEAPVISVKVEPPNDGSPSIPAPIKIRTLTEGGHEVLELYSDSESEEGVYSNPKPAVASRPISVASRLPFDLSNPIVPAAPNVNDCDGSKSEDELVSDSEDEPVAIVSDTYWPDNITSFVRIGNFRITQKVKVERIEYLSALPSIFPVFRMPTAIVIDLSDPKFEIVDPKTGNLKTLDSMVRDADNDAYESSSGTGSTKAKVSFAPGEPAIECRRSPSKCRGAFACDRMNPALRTAERFEVDPASRRELLDAQAETRRQEGTTPEQNVALFKRVLSNSKCKAVDSHGIKCEGAPIMKLKPQGSSRGHEYFIACSGFTPSFNHGHQTHSIPDNVDEQLLAKSLADQPLSDDATKDTPPCTKLGDPHTGHKLQFCPHAHISNGKVVRGRITQYTCSSTRSIYVPTDTTIRKVLIVTNGIPHNHPMPTLNRMSVGLKKVYERCVRRHGVLGATVAKVDNAASTREILDGKPPSAFAPPFYSQRGKANVILGVKREQFPHGMDETGLFHMFLNGVTKPLPEKYIYGYVVGNAGEICVVTCVPYLLKLLDDPGVNAFDNDTTYRRIKSKVNEWELSIYVKTVLRAASVVRAYINRASAQFFETLFDEVQRIKLEVTGRPMPLKRFVRGGNLQVMNADMDGAQILGICRSVMKHNDEAYSGIAKDTPLSRPVHDFKSLVTSDQHAQLANFVYIDSAEKLAEFSKFIRDLGIKKIQDWWAHKEMHPWIIPCIVKSQSRIPADVWDTTPSTTNTNEGQHAWTNSITGTGLSLVEAVEGAYRLDRTVADEIEMSLRTGIVANPNNEVSHRVARNTGRQSTRARNARESEELSDATHDLKQQIAEELEKRRESNTLTKELKNKLRSLKGTGQTNQQKLLSASSSGRVKSAPVRNTSAGRKVEKVQQTNNFPSSSTKNAQPPDPTQSNLSPRSIPEPLAPRSDLGQMFDFTSNTDFGVGVGVSTETLALPQQDGGEFQNDFTRFDWGDLFGCGLSADTLIPSTTSPDPLQEFLDLFPAPSTNNSFIFSSTLEPGLMQETYPDASYSEWHNLTLSVASSTSSIECPTTSARSPTPWPVLPPPPIDSPMGSPVKESSTNTSCDSAAIARTRRNTEVDLSNILPEKTTRSRAPTERKRAAAKQISERKPKKSRRT
ncbi:hypothetical protein B0H14DRAFT_3139049 [Mycena olivaceomarginata]|nr:hypothetical protein B0H14DRAFT_3139049 [Mycena olivaceomarginata]